MRLWESNISVVLLGEAVDSYTPDGESPVVENITSLRFNLSSMDTWNLIWINKDHLTRLNTPRWLIVKLGREGKVKRTPIREWNKTWNYKLPSNGIIKSLTMCLLRNESTTYK